MKLFKKKTEFKTSTINAHTLRINKYKNKYRLAAEEIYTALGAGNYQNPYNCMTRFRANIINKDLVDIATIKKIPLVKGINWNGPELQIIIGAEVYKVIDEFKKYEIDATQEITTKEDVIIEKPPLGRRFMAAVVGIIQPAIALIIAGGMLVAIYSLLTQWGGPLHNSMANPAWKEGMDDSLKNISISMQTLYLFNVWDALFYILANIVMPSIGIFFIYNTAKYFNANPWFAIAVGLFLLAQGFFPLIVQQYYPNPATDVDHASFGHWLADKQYGKNGFFLFALGDYPILVMGYQGSIIPYVVGGLLVVFIDKWIKTWMPTSLDITFRGLLVIILTMFALWFILAPISSLIEYGLFYAMTWFGKIPYGFGTAIFAFFWQPLVIIGCHTPLGVAIDTAIMNGNPQLLGTANVTPYWGQLGAVIAVGIISKNMTLKKMAFATVPAGIFGITEPIIYGVNLPRVKPFLYGCVAAAVGGFLVGILDLDMDTIGTFGILSCLRFNDAAVTGHNIVYSLGTEVGLLFMTWGITFAVGFITTYFAYKERKNELSYYKKAINKLSQLLQIEKPTLYKEFETETKQIKLMKNDYKKINKYYGEVSRLENQLLVVENKESKARAKMYSKLVHLRNKLLKKDDSILLEKFNTLNNKYSTYSMTKEKDVIQNKMNKLVNDNAQLLKTTQTQKESIYKDSQAILESHNVTDKVFENIMWNALNSVEISFELEDAKQVKFKKKGVA